jgi:MerR family transcriptional regulator, heat shock protein HspR
MQVPFDHPVFTIGIVSQLLGLHEQTLRQYERLGLISPCRSIRKTRLYSQADVDRLECITYLVKTCGVNLAGVKIMVTLSSQYEEVEQLLKNHGFSSSPEAETSQKPEEKNHVKYPKPRP